MTCKKSEHAACYPYSYMSPCDFITSTPLPTTSVPSQNCDKHKPPLKNHESIPGGKCSNISCINGTIQHEHVYCEPSTIPVCLNNYPALLNDSGCCPEYDCQCICRGFGDPHYITFDGTYYPFQGNCSYVLVKEIIPKYNFSVIIDNVYCDSEDGLSCPKSLTVYYKSFEIVMSQKISNGIVTNLIYVNNELKTLPFENKDFRITDNGIESLVVIPEISAQVAFMGMMFSINIPWQKFHGNTEGQCGTCDNNRTDDCRLPNGTIISSCQKMAPYWNVHENNSYCPPFNPPPPEKCSNYSICDIISGQVFEKCHDLVSYEQIKAACNYDVCRMNSSTIGCTSLQMYAEQCSMSGVCIDWRGSTDGVCEFKCEAPKVYKACGPQIEETCDSSFNLMFISKPSAFSVLERMIWEGCYCPNDTILLSPYSDKCIPNCTICHLPNGRWEPAGATWKQDNGCEQCVCSPETLTAVCEAPVCPTLQPVTCDEYQKKIIENVGCCQNVTCVCDVSLCPNNKQTCPVGYIQDVVMGACCPEYTCLPNHDVCVFNNSEYKPGADLPQQGCDKCICSNEMDKQRQWHEIQCTPPTCDTYCPLGYVYQPDPEKCCGYCTQVKCVVMLGNITQTISPGQIWSPPTNKCLKFECVKIGTQFIVIEAKFVCPPINEKDCVPGTITVGPDGCCKTCINKTQHCGVSKTFTFLESGGCRTKDLVEITTCQGSCSTSSMYSMETRAIQHSCSCCQEQVISQRQAELFCADGSKVTHTYIFIEKCGCTVTECVVNQNNIVNQGRRR
ncbi:intestinal mucin-like protein [Hoplias malabaricus]|uniref:intestinal mucin-like protein n=1 Tax=Hoplias malabaricus TaxID=27720 RepID=UPI0034630D50